MYILLCIFCGPILNICLKFSRYNLSNYNLFLSSTYCSSKMVFTSVDNLLNIATSQRQKDFLLTLINIIISFSNQMEDDLADLMQEIGYSSCSRQDYTILHLLPFFQGFFFTFLIGLSAKKVTTTFAFIQCFSWLSLSQVRQPTSACTVICWHFFVFYYAIRGIVSQCIVPSWTIFNCFYFVTINLHLHYLFI